MSKESGKVKIAMAGFKVDLHLDLLTMSTGNVRKLVNKSLPSNFDPNVILIQEKFFRVKRSRISIISEHIHNYD
jgi:hypothetical protein